MSLPLGLYDNVSADMTSYKATCPLNQIILVRQM